MDWLIWQLNKRCRVIHLSHFMHVGYLLWCSLWRLFLYSKHCCCCDAAPTNDQHITSFATDCFSSFLCFYVSFHDLGFSLAVSVSYGAAVERNKTCSPDYVWCSSHSSASTHNGVACVFWHVITGWAACIWSCRPSCLLKSCWYSSSCLDW